MNISIQGEQFAKYGVAFTPTSLNYRDELPYTVKGIKQQWYLIRNNVNRDLLFPFPIFQNSVSTNFSIAGVECFKEIKQENGNILIIPLDNS